ncbi:MAG: hypothetical protein HYV65_00245 [Candidatus Spechtbacteria bacterium]|nr:hypothetical protein [Candidatus Spechtbacteria bacterium]
MTKETQKHIHFIGISGVTMAPLAVLYKKLGWKVTGSDRAFFPPMSTYLKKNGIAIMPGYKEKHLSQRPDLVLVMAFISKKNPELAYAIKNKIPYKTYGEVLPELIEKENSIVVAGSCGKTSVTSLVAWLLEVAKFNPSFMIGGIAKNFTDGIRSTDSKWSVLEGDEYPIANWKKTSRFLAYHPKYLILTGATWDHMDMFPTKSSYINTFHKLALKMPKNGVIIANRRGENAQEVLNGAKAQICWYDENSAEGFTPPFLGAAWKENIGSVVALAKQIGIEDKQIKRALRTFKGIKRRQEVRYQDKNIVVIDDNAHSPEKVEGALEAIRAQFPCKSIIAIYEPGNRSDLALKQKEYHKCFAKADYVLLPRLSGTSAESQEFNKKLARKIQKDYKRVQFITEDEEVISQIKKIVVGWRKRDIFGCVVFMSQKGFRGMIEETIRTIKQKNDQFSI